VKFFLNKDNKFMKIQKNILAAIGVVTVLNAGLYSTSLSAKTIGKVVESKVSAAESKIKRFLTKDYNAELLNTLAEIENDLQNNNIKGVHAKSEVISDELVYFKSEAKKHEAKNVQLSGEYKGDKVLELKYGSWFNSKKLILPLSPKGTKFTVESLKDRIVLSAYFRENEISDASVRYVTFNTESDKFRIDLQKLLSSVEEENITYIRESIKNIYDDVLVYHSEDVSLVPKIRDSLVVAKYLIDNNQFKAAKNTIGITDSLALKLIEETSNSPIEQEKIKNLRKELNDVTRVADANYLSEWEKVPEGIENFWKNK
jgi:hypothetical protein